VDEIRTCIVTRMRAKLLSNYPFANNMPDRSWQNEAGDPVPVNRLELAGPSRLAGAGS
jgi:hypothetical protein